MQAVTILDLQKQLTLLGDGARKDMNGGINEDSITSMTPVDKVCFMLSFTSKHLVAKYEVVL